MTPQERELLNQLFDRLASLENQPRDPEAVRAINEGLQRAPNALYPLVQTALVQDEALKRADARIRALESELGIEPGQPAQQGGFLDTMRDALFGKSEPQRGSVPSVRPGAADTAGGAGMSSAWRTTSAPPGAGYAAQPQAGAPYAPAGSPSGSFLGTAAAAAAGVVGGSLLMNSFRGMFGGGHTPAQSAFSSGVPGSPWGPPASGSDLARDAGVNDIGSGGTQVAGAGDASQPAGLFDQASAGDSDDGYSDDSDGDYDDDFGDDGDLGGDFGDNT